MVQLCLSSVDMHCLSHDDIQHLIASHHLTYIVCHMMIYGILLPRIIWHALFIFCCYSLNICCYAAGMLRHIYIGFQLLIYCILLLVCCRFPKRKCQADMSLCLVNVDVSISILCLNFACLVCFIFVSFIAYQFVSCLFADDFSKENAKLIFSVHVMQC